MYDMFQQFCSRCVMICRYKLSYEWESGSDFDMILDMVLDVKAISTLETQKHNMKSYGIV